MDRAVVAVVAAATETDRRSGVALLKLQLNFPAPQAPQDIAAVVDRYPDRVEFLPELRQRSSEPSAFLPSQVTVKAVERP